MISELDEYLQKIYSCDTCAEVEIVEAIDKLEEGLEKIFYRILILLSLRTI